MSKGDSTRSIIVGRATELSTQIGLEGVSIGVLAEELKLSKSGLFAHFRSKEALQLAVIEHAAERFSRVVVRPTLSAARGEPRVIAAFEHWRSWPQHAQLPGGCFFLAAAAEFDDRPGPVRDAIAQQIRAWLDVLAEVARGAVREGHFGAHVDGHQFAFDLFGILLAYHQTARLLGRPDAEKRLRSAFASLLARAHTLPEPAAAEPRKRRSPKSRKSS